MLKEPSVLRYVSAKPPCVSGSLLTAFFIHCPKLLQIAASQNRVYLTADNLVLNLQDEGFTR